MERAYHQSPNGQSDLEPVPVQPMRYQPQPEHGYYHPQGAGDSHGPSPVYAASYMAPPSSAAPEKQQDGAPASGIKKGACIALMAVMLILLAAIIGLSAGLGVSQSRLRDEQSNLQKALASASAAATATQQVSTTTATAAPTSCPVSDGSTYTTSEGDAEFRQHCGIDYGDGEATDVGSAQTETFDACLDKCASSSNCTGAGWGYLEIDGELEAMCYLKKDLTTSHEAVDSWAFGVLVTNSSSG